MRCRPKPWLHCKDAANSGYGDGSIVDVTVETMAFNVLASLLKPPNTSWIIWTGPRYAAPRWFAVHGILEPISVYYSTVKITSRMSYDMLAHTDGRHPLPGPPTPCLCERSAFTASTRHLLGIATCHASDLLPRPPSIPMPRLTEFVPCPTEQHRPVATDCRYDPSPTEPYPERGDLAATTICRTHRSPDEDRYPAQTATPEIRVNGGYYGLNGVEAFEAIVSWLVSSALCVSWLVSSALCASLQGLITQSSFSNGDAHERACIRLDALRRAGGPVLASYRDTRSEFWDAGRRVSTYNFAHNTALRSLEFSLDIMVRQPDSNWPTAAAELRAALSTIRSPRIEHIIVVTWIVLNDVDALDQTRCIPSLEMVSPELPSLHAVMCLPLLQRFAACRRQIGASVYWRVTEQGMGGRYRTSARAHLPGTVHTVAQLPCCQHLLP
ncbi:uncharacterized protein C8Q71DRAFT_113076 [Rhodofomes roseus]|uniref:Uncharacterized protein n=1 Tax=Rhodofomes roseus TaxID=34475 RepID=A0ABQ8KCU1_9APHY|nr:uncharacterized protein C8Q71DRAFT_113076 [Rhodofomes roseus]KAH9835310.1 hypothetical protein C8Q71DRAFT_113076 [Rhodofomes roseus]